MAKPCIKKGARAMIVNRTPDGRTIEEGMATLEEFVRPWDSMSEVWMVRFDEEPETYRRIVWYKDVEA